MEKEAITSTSRLMKKIPSFSSFMMRYMEAFCS